MRRSRGFSFRLVLLTVLCALTIWPVLPAGAQVQEGATMTVLEGQVAVIHPDGSAVQPAPSGTIVRQGDEIRTLTPGGALITFFTGTEIEMGQGTILVVQNVTRSGERVDVSLEQVLGVTINRVQTFSDPGSSYRIEAGGAVALIRGTTFALIGPVATSQGNVVVLVCLDDCSPASTFAGCPLQPFTGFGVGVARGEVATDCEVFSVGRGENLFNAAFEGVTTTEQALTSGNPGNANPGTGQKSPSERDREHQNEDQPNNQPLAAASPSPSPGPLPTTRGLICTNIPRDGSDCAQSFPLVVPPNTAVGSSYQLSIQTLIGGTVTTETFSCGPIGADGSGPCSFHTNGRIFQGSAIVERFTLTGGGTQNVNSFIICFAPTPLGVPCGGADLGPRTVFSSASGHSSETEPARER